MDKYQTYTEFKSSGIEWIGPVPDHWGIKPLFGVASTESLKNETGEKTNVLSLSYGNIIRRDVEKNFGLLPESFNTYQLVSSGDLILRLTDLQNDKRSLRVGQAKEEGIITSAYLKLTAKNIDLDERYFYRLLHSYDTTKVFYGMGGGLRQSMKFEEMRRLPMLVPTLDEQQKIAIFLDHETAKIDTLIEKQQQLIKLLKEKRQAVIGHAVTKGLNPNAPMRDSGVEWLGEVPEHWDVAKVSHRYEIRLGKMLDVKKVTGNHLGSYLRNTDVQWDRINTDDLPQMDFRPEEYQRYSVKNGDLIVCEGGDIGRSAIWNLDETCFYQKALHRLRPHYHSKDHTRFMFYLMFDAVHQERLSGGIEKATIAHLPAETFRQYRFAYPPHVEQVTISNFLDKINTKFELVEATARKQIELFQERRTALISAAVTGKIDVRNWQAPEPSHTNNKEVAP